HYTTLIESDDQWKSEIDRHRDFLTAIGVEASTVEPIVWTSPRDEKYAKDLFHAEGLDSQTTIAVFPGAQNPLRGYRRYAEVLSQFPEFSLVALGSLAEIVLAEEICRDFPGKAVNLAGRTSPRQMASIVRRSRLYLGSDSAAAHMACAVGVPNVALIDGGHFGRFVPYSPLTTAVSLPLECYRCKRECPYPGRAKCIAGISAEVVVEAVRIALAGEGCKPRLVVHQEPVSGLEKAVVPAWRDCTDLLCVPSEVIPIVAEVSRSTAEGPPRAVGVAAENESSGDPAIALSGDALHSQRDCGPIAIDAVFFQWANTGIARLWRSLLGEWSRNGFGSRLVVFDRGNSAPRFPGIRYRDVPPFPAGGTLDSDCDELERACRDEGASLFTSTYYTFPRDTHSVFFAYDMIPEATGMDLSQHDWERKRLAIQHASSYVAISESTANDLVRFHPGVLQDRVTMAHCGVDDAFRAPPEEEVRAYRQYSGAPEHYYVYVGSRIGYKKAKLLFDAFPRLKGLSRPGLLLVGGAESLESEFAPAAAGRNVVLAPMDDDELRVAYAAATALVFPSRYEGFGLPVLEAMSCGCPVIACPNSSIPEVGGDAVIYVDEADPDGLANAMVEVARPDVRQRLIEAGVKRAAEFTWSAMAAKVAKHFDDAQAKVEQGLSQRTS
ncbi:MAG: glycosyltransferase, partial [Coriobacteriia bacterium]|nr:glycosyltransferase [Coriobacteriia bacterium]